MLMKIKFQNKATQTYAKLSKKIYIYTIIFFFLFHYSLHCQYSSFIFSIFNIDLNLFDFHTPTSLQSLTCTHYTHTIIHMKTLNTLAEKRSQNHPKFTKFNKEMKKILWFIFFVYCFLWKVEQNFCQQLNC